MQPTKHLRGPNLAVRFGSTSAFKRSTGYTESELGILVAIATCERSLGGNPTRTAIAQTTRHGRTNTVSELQALGLTHIVDKVGQVAFYGLTEAGWGVLAGLGVERGERAA